MLGRSARVCLVLTYTHVSAAATRGIRVIGAGQGRTGTESLRLALNALGVGPTYHMSQLLGIDASRPVSPLEMLGLVDGHCYQKYVVDGIAFPTSQEIADKQGERQKGSAGQAGAKLRRVLLLF